MNQNSSRAHTGGTDLSRRWYEWNAGKPVGVRIAFDVIDRLERASVENFRSLAARGSEIGGVLLGCIEGSGPFTVNVEEVELIECDYSRGPLYQLSETDLKRLDAALAANGSKVVGYFRSCTRKALSLDDSDLGVMQSRFKSPGQVALLVRPFAAKPSVGGVFIWENGSIRGEASYLEFPFQSSQLTASTLSAPAAPALKSEQPAQRPLARARVIPMSSRVEVAADPAGIVPAPGPAPETKSAPAAREAAPPAPQAKVEEPAPAPESAPQPEARHEQPPAPHSSWDAALPEAEGWTKRLKPTWIWGLVAAAVLACSGVLFVYPGIVRKSAPPPVALSLRIERTAGDLLLTWNRESSAVREARSATLTISDGERQENYQMDVAQLRSGSIVYSPLTPDVSFKLDVKGSNQSNVASEMVRVLRTRPSPMEPKETAQTAQPAQAPAQPQSAASTPAESAPAEQPEDPAPKPKRQAPKPFNLASLSDRLRPATPSDLPLPTPLPQVSGTSASFNIGSITSHDMPAIPPARSEGEGAAEIRQPQLVTSVKPEYPAIARQRRITGAVRLKASIGTDGRVKSIRVIGGNEVLQPAAIEAVKKWVYTPMLLNGKPVEVDKEITLNFVLN